MPADPQLPSPPPLRRIALSPSQQLRLTRLLATLLQQALAGPQDRSVQPASQEVADEPARPGP